MNLIRVNGTDAQETEFNKIELRRGTANFRFTLEPPIQSEKSVKNGFKSAVGCSNSLNSVPVMCF